MSLIDAAALPEVVCTVWSNVFLTANLQPGETLLVHGGSSGIGTMAIQLGREVGAQVAVTAGSADKLAACRELGAEILINYREEDFVERIRSVTGGVGANVILDNMGAKYLDRNIRALAEAGRLVIIGMQGGTKGELDIAALLASRAAVIATSYAQRSREGHHRGGGPRACLALDRGWPDRPGCARALSAHAGSAGPPQPRSLRSHRQDPADALTSRVREERRRVARSPGHPRG